MFMDLPTTHQLTLIQPTRTSVSGFIAGHICVPAGGGEDREPSIGGDGGSEEVVGEVRPPGGEIERLGIGAYRGSLRCLRHSISAVGPKIPYTKKRSLGLVHFTSRQHQLVAREEFLTH